jgi:site-specific DNA-methyltransferase (adenine-specific)
MTFAILTGDNRELLKSFPDNHFDSIVTDPPYGIDFLGKAWDANTGALATYQECLRVLKPGGHILAFSAARTYHHLAVTVEQAGFEIRDQIMWIYSSGFPKSQDIGRSIQRGIKGSEYHSKEEWEKLKGYKGMPSGDSTFGHSNQTDGQKSAGLSGKVVKVTDPVAQAWSGWGTALKPAHEPIVMARKPIKLSIAKNCLQWGVGAVNIDACRIPVEGPDTRGGGSDGWDRVEFGQAEPNKSDGTGYEPNELGRFPSNVIGDIPLYQKYFYCPKVSRAERHVGFDDPGPMFQGDRFDVYMPTAGKTDPNKQISAVEKKVEGKGNNHPTVKPIELMKYLIQLVTPPGGHVLDPFNGSGSTGCAAVELDMDYTGIELDAKYVDIACKRIQAWHEATHPTTFQELFE